jgi:hypothetical protein
LVAGRDLGGRRDHASQAGAAEMIAERHPSPVDFDVMQEADFAGAEQFLDAG